MTIFIPSHRIILNLLIAISVFFFLFLYSLSSSAYANDAVALNESVANEGIRVDDVYPISVSMSSASVPYLTMPLGSTSDVLIGFGQLYTDPSGRPIKHSGIDIEAPPGSTVRAASSGRVSYVGPTVGAADRDINCLTITDKSGNLITYRPIDTDLKIGSVVEQGDVIGSLRELGDPSSMQPHLNLSARDSGGKYIDPISLFLLVAVEVPESKKPNLSENVGSIKEELLGIIPNKGALPSPAPIITDEGTKIKEALSDKTSAAAELLGQAKIISPNIEISAPQAHAPVLPLKVLPRNKVGAHSSGKEGSIAARKADGVINELGEARVKVHAAASSLPRDHQDLMSSATNTGYQKLRSSNMTNTDNSSSTKYLSSAWPSISNENNQSNHRSAIWHTLSKMSSIIVCIMAASMVLIYFSVSIFILKMRQPTRTLSAQQALRLA